MAQVSDSGETLSLNIMPMLDIFSILILFLLMNFSADPVNHDVADGVELPTSITTTPLDEVPSISVSKTGITVNDKKVVAIIDGDVPERDQAQGAIYPLFTELKVLAESSKKFSATNDRRTGPITLEMDKSHSFKLLKRIMLTAQQAEFVQFKLMVGKQNG